MRPVKSTPAHQTDKFAELVCSNSLKSESENTAPWLLKEEMRRVDSLLLRIAKETAVPAGHALAVDRETFAAKVTEAISAEPLSRSFARKSRASMKPTGSPSSPPGRSLQTRFRLRSRAFPAAIIFSFTIPSAPSLKPTPST